jgi:hypothetical protein
MSDVPWCCQNGLQSGIISTLENGKGIICNSIQCMKKSLQFTVLLRLFLP